MKATIKFYIAFGLLAFLANKTYAQDAPVYTLKTLTDSALAHNYGLAIKHLQVREREAKVKEAQTKRLMSVSLDGAYQYNQNLASLTVPAGAIGVYPIGPSDQLLLPNQPRDFSIGNHNVYNVGVSAYQPLTQQARIATGIQIDKIDKTISEKEVTKTSLQIKLAVKQLYYRTLIAQKQLEESLANYELAKTRLNDVESGNRAGKATQINTSGLAANVADEEHHILQQKIQIQNYKTDLAKLAGIATDRFELSNLTLTPAIELDSLAYANELVHSNPDVQLAQLTESKAWLGVRAAKESNLPDIGLIGGYTHVNGNPIFPSNNVFGGISFKWNLQSLLANRHVTDQRKLQLAQAEKYREDITRTVHDDLEKAYRKINQNKALLAAAAKALDYRRKDLQLQQDRQTAGLNVLTDLIASKSLFAKAEADYYAAQLSLELSKDELDYLVGR